MFLCDIEWRSLSKIFVSRVTLKNVKAFLSKVNCKINTVKLNELFQEVDKRHRNELSFDDFAKLYQIIMLPTTVSENH